jgi:asparagine synthase (glutamine-hydrolysing)
LAAVAAVIADVGSPDAAAVERMLAAAPHRGKNTSIEVVGRCALGVADRDGRDEGTVSVGDGLAVAFAGTLDNVEEVTRLGRSNGGGEHTPASLVRAAWHTLGEALPNRLRGTFACVVTDGSKAWAFRDHIGLDTLFYREDRGHVYVASEPKQVLRGAAVPRAPDVDVVEAFFYGDLEDHTLCALRGVRRVIAATLVSTDGRSLQTRPYWDPAGLLETAKLSASEAAEHFRALLAQAVGRALSGDDIVSLSGGVDSPPIATYAAHEYERRWGRPIPALSAVYPSFPESDETEYIRLVADDLGLPLHTYEPGRQGLERLQYWVELFDGPWTTWSPEGTAERCAHAQALGARTILSGEFAEQVSAIKAYLLTHLLWKGRFRAAAGQLRSQYRAGIGRRQIARDAMEAFVPRFMDARRLRTVDDALIPPWIDVRRIAQRNAGMAIPARRRWVRAQLPFFGADPTGEADIYSHALFGIRARRPWADVDLWEFFLSLPAETMFPDHRLKGFVRAALRGEVPEAVLDRRTKSYNNQWFEAKGLDYPSLRRWLSDPEHRVAGVDYRRLHEALEGEDMPLSHYLWAKDLATVHVFLELCG